MLVFYIYSYIYSTPQMLLFFFFLIFLLLKKSPQKRPQESQVVATYGSNYINTHNMYRLYNLLSVLIL